MPPPPRYDKRLAIDHSTRSLRRVFNTRSERVRSNRENCVMPVPRPLSSRTAARRTSSRHHARLPGWHQSAAAAAGAGALMACRGDVTATWNYVIAVRLFTTADCEI